MTHCNRSFVCAGAVGLALAFTAGLSACETEDDLAFELGLEDSELDALDDEIVAGPQRDDPYEGPQTRFEFTAEVDPSAYNFLNWHSEETAGSSVCPANQVVTGFDCSGSYCDNVRLECHDFGTTVIPGGTWSMRFEREYGSPGSVKKGHVCPSGTKMTGIDCWDSYCDDIAILCTVATGLDMARCAWSAWYSDDNPSPLYAPGGSAIQGVWCNGTHCDNKSFLICEI